MKRTPGARSSGVAKARDDSITIDWRDSAMNLALLTVLGTSTILHLDNQFRSSLDQPSRLLRYLCPGRGDCFVMIAPCGREPDGITGREEPIERPRVLRVDDQTTTER